MAELVGAPVMFLGHVVEAGLEVAKCLVDALTVASHSLTVHHQLSLSQREKMSILLCHSIN